MGILGAGVMIGAMLLGPEIAIPVAILFIVGFILYIVFHG